MPYVERVSPVPSDRLLRLAGVIDTYAINARATPYLSRWLQAFASGELDCPRFALIKTSTLHGGEPTMSLFEELKPALNFAADAVSDSPDPVRVDALIDLDSGQVMSVAFTASVGSTEKRIGLDEAVYARVIFSGI